MEKKVHKRIWYKVLAGEYMACGISYFNTGDENISYRWKDVTCKKCLAQKIN